MKRHPRRINYTPGRYIRYARLLRIEHQRLAQSEDSYLMRPVARIVASQRRRRS